MLYAHEHFYVRQGSQWRNSALLSGRLVYSCAAGAQLITTLALCGTLTYCSTYTSCESWNCLGGATFKSNFKCALASPRKTLELHSRTLKSVTDTMMTNWPHQVSKRIQISWPQNTCSISFTDMQPEQVAKVRGDLGVTQQNMAVFSEMLSELKPGLEHPEVSEYAP